ncbi:MAG: hypothetical protein LKG21_06315 [Ruminococcus sp.]|jgi:hypothetical protein|nr:hypothetical protein [Ruminococcus sp.]
MQVQLKSVPDGIDYMTTEISARTVVIHCRKCGEKVNIMNKNNNRQSSMGDQQEAVPQTDKNSKTSSQSSSESQHSGKSRKADI